jgi:aryl-alcohol dehydrogenase-like predicted oxidoreductase
MKLKELGHTGLTVSPIGLGLAALGRPAYINLGHDADLGPERGVDELRRRAHAVLDAAYGRGIRYVDAARSYGRAEEFLGSWLESRGLAPGDVTVGSKWGYTYTGGWRVDAERHEVKDLSATTFRRQLDETRSLLGAHLSLYQIHSATLDSGVLDDADVLEGLAGLRATGVAVGFTVTGPDQAATIRRALELDRFDTVQATWNLLDGSAEPALEAAHDAGLGVIVKEALANGRLTARGAPPVLREAAEAAGTTPDALALAAVLARPWADVVLSGAATVDQLESNLHALDIQFGEELASRVRPLHEASETYWEKRATLPWT